MIEISLNKEVWEGLPPKKRHPKRFSLIKLYLSDLGVLQEEVLQVFERLDIAVNMSCETGPMEWFLNREFDPNFASNFPKQKRIWIENTDLSNVRQYAFKDIEDRQPDYAFREGERVRFYYTPRYAFKKIEFIQEANFIVYYAASLELTSNDIIRLKGLIDSYKFLDKNYNVTEVS